MSKLQEKIDLYTEAAEKLSIAIEADLFKLVTKGLGPSIYKEDSELVSSSNQTELETVKKNFLIKKLGLEKDDAELDAIIQKVIDIIGSGNKKKYRALFYYLLVKETGKESVYDVVEKAPAKETEVIEKEKKAETVVKKTKKEKVMEEKVADQTVEGAKEVATPAPAVEKTVDQKVEVVAEDKETESAEAEKVEVPFDVTTQLEAPVYFTS
jgi:small subunit ribosomal protein S1